MAEWGRGWRGNGAHGFGDGYRGGELKLPPGWEECPPFGNPIEISKDNYFKVIPSKVPLSRAYDPLLKNPALSRYTINDAIAAVEQQFQGKVSLVIDLTKSNRYYNFDREVPPQRTLAGQGFFSDSTIIHAKIPCQGHGQSPDAFAVNAAVFEIKRMMAYRPNDYIIVHCTHGFNRTGYVLVNAMVRIASAAGLSIPRCLRRFSAARPPGIYKDAYINDLFKYHHESRTAAQLPTPPVPSWKGTGEEDDEGEPEPPPDPPKEITHERIDEIGEAIPPEEAAMVQHDVYRWLTGTDLPEGRLPHFPGSQPVSLDRQNLSLLHSSRYWVSWKADGTRYLLLIQNQGCYLINREFRVVRLQMRFPTLQKPTALKQYPVGPPHHDTLLDGEMVVDVDPGTGMKTRRYLAYDLVLLRGKLLREEPWLERFKLLQKEVIAPRDREKRYIQRQLPEKFLAPPLAYKYETEACSVRVKEFWPLFRARKVIDKMIPSLCHEADGLILQSCHASYVANTDNSLLKFKFAHLNSVDFFLEVDAAAGSSGGKGYHIYVLDTSRRRGPRGPEWTKKEVQQPVLFPEGVDGRTFHQRIIECCWVEASHSWQFMRIREDKDKPNADYVCDKVVGSIKDNIREHELLDYLESVFYHLPHYQEDVATMPPEAKPAELPPPPLQPSAPLPMPQLGSAGPSAAAAGIVNAGAPADGGEGTYHHQPLACPFWSPPYYGPEPTPPHSPGQAQLPDIWIPHDPATYPQEYLPVYEDPNMPPPDDPALHTWGQAAEPPEQAGEPQPLGTEVEGAAGQQGWVQPPWEAGADNPDHQEWEAGTGGDGGGGSQEAAEGERVLPARAPAKPAGHQGNAGWEASGSQAVDAPSGGGPYYEEEHEGNRWGKQWRGARTVQGEQPLEDGAKEEGCAPEARSGAPASNGAQQGAQACAGAEGDEVDGSEGEVIGEAAGVQGPGHSGMGAVGEHGVEEEQQAGDEEGAGHVMGEQGAAAGKGVKRGRQKQELSRAKRVKKMDDDEFFDDL